ncbi:hypothetical protein NtRootA1_10980 [Arthrobacter sp. NtRootA1]|nr:hypothetical protein NtRootA1_10980 [Arthrobacter sp. NtRootA1]
MVAVQERFESSRGHYADVMLKYILTKHPQQLLTELKCLVCDGLSCEVPVNQQGYLTRNIRLETGTVSL